MDDAMIIDLYWQRNEDAIAETACKYGSYCHSISFNILRIHEDAEECVNDTYEHAWSSIPPERPNRLKAWLGVVVRNLTIDLWNKNHARKRYDAFTLLLSELDECVPAKGDIERSFELEELGRSINEWLSALPSKSRKVFMLRYWYGESTAQIAKRKGMTANAVAQKLFRMRSQLKEHLEKEGISI